MLVDFKKALENQNYLILDTETTGLDRGEVVQIAIIDSYGDILLNSLVRPKLPIPADAIAIHNIDNELVSGSITWPELVPRIIDIVRDRQLVVYNALYDRKMMHQSAERWEMEKIEWKEISDWHCAMDAYAEFYGAWNDYHQSYRWQRLSFAAENCGVRVANTHEALGDCLMTLGVVKKMLEA